MTTRHVSASAKPLQSPKDLPVKDLYLDPKNPRLASEEFSVDQQDEIADILWQDRAVNELVDSIAASGYWRHEELFAAKEGGKLVVIEGNRRLAAVKLLTDDGLRNRLGIGGIPTQSQSEKDRLEKLPVIECRREDVWQYIGFKHVNGPQDWDCITDETLGSKNGVAALRAGLPLDTALKAGRGDERLLREALVLAEQKLKEARGLVLTGYFGEDTELLNGAQMIQTIAENIASEMADIASGAAGRKSSKKRKK